MRREPALITMPTGSGKTVVLMAAGFLLRAERVLVLTPSKLVRRQIATEFKTLAKLKALNCLPDDVPTPVVKEIAERVTTKRAWNKLREADVCVGIPTSIAHDLANCPKDLFDLVLVDEAHHAAAKKWQALLAHFRSARVVLFTATPFRRDRRELPAKIIFNYPLSMAHEDEVFSTIEFQAVIPKRADPDVAIAKETERVFKKDRKDGFRHFVMVRTDRRKRAAELLKVYERHTSLRLAAIDSGMSYKRVVEALDALRAGNLDGVISVNMLGEGYDFPNLKIAAIHRPHKSLEITLQFIGRFARTGGDAVGRGVFVAVPSEIEIEAKKLFQEDAIWQHIISNLSETRILGEITRQEVFESFNQNSSRLTSH